MSEDNVVKNEAIDDLAGRFLTFHVDDSVYGIELLHVIEIISIQSITAVPGIPKYIKGIINLRGKIVPVIDMRLKFNLEEQEYNERTCIIVVNIDEMSVGLIVDSVSEVVTVESENLAKPPEFNSVNSSKYLSSIAKVGGRVILNIDCEKVFHDDVSAPIFN